MYCRGTISCCIAYAIYCDGMVVGFLFFFLVGCIGQLRCREACVGYYAATLFGVFFSVVVFDNVQSVEC